MQEIKTLIETEPAYNAVVNEMFPIKEIEEELCVILNQAEESRMAERMYGMGYDRAILQGDYIKAKASRLHMIK